MSRTDNCEMATPGTVMEGAFDYLNIGAAQLTKTFLFF